MQSEATLVCFSGCFISWTESEVNRTETNGAVTRHKTQTHRNLGILDQY